MTATAAQRDERILGLLEGRELVSVGELAASVGVSAVTMRKDLDRLSRSAVIERVRGGARLRTAEEGPLAERLGHRVGAKRAVARSAADLVGADAVIAIDSSSTGYYLALELADRTDLTIVTNSLRIAAQLAERAGPAIVVLGGTVRRTSHSTVGFPAELLRGYGTIDLAFLGVSALSPEQGLLERSFSEAETKRAMASAAELVIGLFDSSKASGFGQHSVVPAAAVDRLITDDEFDEADAAPWRALGVTVDRAAQAAPPSAAR